MKKKTNLNFLDIVFIFINIFYKLFRHKLNFKITENFIDIKENHENIKENPENKKEKGLRKSPKSLADTERSRS